jgi:hypothetical protein
LKETIQLDLDTLLKQRSEKQKEFSADPTYTKYRIDAMNRAR